MAVTKITPIEGKVNKLTALTFTAATAATDGFELNTKDVGDEKLVVVVYNADSASKKITLKKPTNGGYAAASADEALSMGTGTYAFLRIETARFANYDGTVKLVPESINVKIAVLA